MDVIGIEASWYLTWMLPDFAFKVAPTLCHDPLDDSVETILPYRLKTTILVFFYINRYLIAFIKIKKANSAGFFFCKSTTVSDVCKR